MERNIYLFLIFLFPAFCVAQQYDNTWLLGYDGGVSSDTTFGNSVLTFDEYKLRVKNNQTDNIANTITMDFRQTNTNISNEEGHLLFYFNGLYVEDSTFQIMANGDTLNPYDVNTFGYGLPQGGAIIPYPEHDNQYLLFNITRDYIPIPDIYYEGIEFYYSIIDMTENNGFGEVILRKELLIADTITYGKIVTTRHANGRDWWILINERFTNKYYTILVNPNGPQLQEQQVIGDTINDELGQGRFSPDGSFYVVYNGVSTAIGSFLDIYDFDRCTGLLSNSRHIAFNDSPVAAGMAISPNSRFVYASSGLFLYQYDLWADNIEASRITIGEYDGFQGNLSTTFHQMQLAPDGKIYMACGNTTFYLHVIHNPNEKGLACNFEQHGIKLPTRNGFSVPYHPNYRLGPIDGSFCDTLGIDNIPFAAFRHDQDTLDDLYFEFTDLSAYEPTDWFWDFGDGTTSQDTCPVHTFPAYENYEVCLTVSNDNGEDTYCKTIYLQVVGAEQLSNGDGILIYPNPAGNDLYLEKKGAGFFYWDRVELIDVNGRVCRHWSGVNMVSVADMAEGIYVVRLWKDGVVWTRKILIGR